MGYHRSSPLGQEGSRIDSEPFVQNRNLVNVKNRNFSSTESLQPSIIPSQPNRKKLRTGIPPCSEIRNVSSRAVRGHRSICTLACPNNMSLARPGFKRGRRLVMNKPAFEKSRSKAALEPGTPRAACANWASTGICPSWLRHQDKGLSPVTFRRS